MGTAKIERPATGASALLIIDMINDLEFFRRARHVERRPECGSSDHAAKSAGPVRRRSVVYVNDNYGDWHPRDL
jgi:hypothetical protein